MRQEACGQCRASPPATARVLYLCVSLGPMGSIPGTIPSDSALTFRIGHWIRHAKPDFDSGFPYSENFPMGMSTEYIQKRLTKHTISGNEIVAHYRTAQRSVTCDA